MNNLPRERLREAVVRFGQSFSDDPRQCGAVLNDLCGEYKGEVSVLVAAVREGVASDLITSGSSVPRELLLRKHIKHLEKFHFTEDAARWSVESWALALGLMSDEDLSPVPVASSTADKPSQQPERVVESPARPEEQEGRGGVPQFAYICGALAALMLIVTIVMVVLKSQADEEAATARAAQARAEQTAVETEAAKENAEREAQRRVDEARKAREASEKELGQLKQIQPRAEMFEPHASVTDYGATMYVTIRAHNLQSVQCVVTAYVYDAEGKEVKSSSKTILPTQADATYDKFSIYISSGYEYWNDGTYTFKVVLKKWTGEGLAESAGVKLGN